MREEVAAACESASREALTEVAAARKRPRGSRDGALPAVGGGGGAVATEEQMTRNIFEFRWQRMEITIF